MSGCLALRLGVDCIWSESLCMLQCWVQCVSSSYPELVLTCTVQGSNNMSATISHSSGTPSPVQDGIALTEREVTQLMEDDMGSAMQYLQSKGLCLMPIALATAISTTNTSRGAQGRVGERQRTSAAGSNGGLITDGLVSSEQASKDNSREVESVNGTASMGTHNGPKCEGKLTDGP